MTAQNAVDPSPERLGASESDRFESAFREVSRSAFLLARQLGRGTDEARDIVQEAALQAWRYRSGRVGEFRPWFLTIVYRLCRRRAFEWFPLPTGWDKPVPAGIDSQIDPDIVAALRTLPTRQRAALWLRYGEDLTISDVARVMHLTDTAAKQLLFRGREGLRQKLTTHEP